MFSLFGNKEQAAEKSPRVVIADLDAMIGEPGQIKLLGKWHTFKPMAVEDYFKSIKAMDVFFKKEDGSQVTADEMINRYYEILHPLCDTISLEDLNKLSLQQLTALFQVIVDTISGRIFGDQKKTLEKIQAILDMK